MAKLKLLYVDDENVNLTNFKIAFKSKYQIFTAASSQEALEIFKDNNDIAIVIADQRMPGMTGVELLHNIMKRNEDVIRIILTAYTAASDIIDSVNRGHIYQYILKPWIEKDLLQLLDKASEKYLLVRENRRLVKELEKDITEHKRMENELRKSYKELQHLSTRLIDAQENERKQISLELHDEMGQAMVAARLCLKGIKRTLPSNLIPQVEEKLTDLNTILNEVSGQITELSLDLRPSMLDDLGLIPTLYWYFEKTQKRTHLDIKFETIDMTKKLDSDKETVFYRISQEALNNVIKHADAENVSIQMERRRESVVLLIKDDGKGFDVEETLMRPMKDRIGLLGMQERAALVGGNLDVQSRKGRGTQIHVVIPLP